MAQVCNLADGVRLKSESACQLENPLTTESFLKGLSSGCVRLALKEQRTVMGSLGNETQIIKYKRAVAGLRNSGDALKPAHAVRHLGDAYHYASGDGKGLV